MLKRVLQAVAANSRLKSRHTIGTRARELEILRFADHRRAVLSNAEAGGGLWGLDSGFGDSGFGVSDANAHKAAASSKREARDRTENSEFLLQHVQRNRTKLELEIENLTGLVARVQADAHLQLGQLQLAVEEMRRAATQDRVEHARLEKLHLSRMAPEEAEAWALLKELAQLQREGKGAAEDTQAFVNTLLTESIT